jgi:Ran GTPase-activating protein (RanGAP) involved in mRNA processing and transport
VCQLARLIITSEHLEILDLGYNSIGSVACFCLSEALVITKSLQFLSVESNPLGKAGLNLLMRAQTRNTRHAFQINFKNADGQGEDFKNQLFDSEKPEGPQTLNLAKVYD